MNPQFNEVLLTAYLDNEVTDDERASVEEQLQSSETSRRLLEELRSVRNLVSQLHFSLPARRLQQAPWNEPALPDVNGDSISRVSPGTALNETRWYQTIPLQRLASLAALIAIAVLASVLLRGPSTKSVRLSENRRTETASDTTAFQSPAADPSLASLPPAMLNLEKAMESKSGIDGVIGDSQQVVDDFVKLDSLGTRGSNEFNKEIFFRYRANKSDRQSGIASAEKPSASPRGESLGRKNSPGVANQRVEAEVGIEIEAMLVEFQIPIANWDQGAQRLRKLGMVLPEKLPTVEYLEFTAIPIAGTNRDAFFNAPAFETPTDRFVVDVTAAKVVDLSQWQFSDVERLEKVTQSKSEIPAKDPVAKDKKEIRPSSSTIRIRVRPIR